MKELPAQLKGLLTLTKPTECRSAPAELTSCVASLTDGIANLASACRSQFCTTLRTHNITPTAPTEALTHSCHAAQNVVHVQQRAHTHAHTLPRTMMTRLRGVAAAMQAEASPSSSRKVDRPSSRLSEAPIRVSTCVVVVGFFHGFVLNIVLSLASNVKGGNRNDTLDSSYDYRYVARCIAV